VAGITFQAKMGTMVHAEVEDWLPLKGRWLDYFRQGMLTAIMLFLLLKSCGNTGMAQAKRGQRGTAVTQIRNFRTAIEQYTADHGQPPSDLEWLITPPNSAPAAKNWKGPYLMDVTTVPMDPWGHPFEYGVPGPAGQPYWIASYGEDGRLGGTGGAADVTLVSALSTRF
jgi:general secretion pathway protein G